MQGSVEPDEESPRGDVPSDEQEESPRKPVPSDEEVAVDKRPEALLLLRLREDMDAVFHKHERELLVLLQSARASSSMDCTGELTVLTDSAPVGVSTKKQSRQSKQSVHSTPSRLSTQAKSTELSRQLLRSNSHASHWNRSLRRQSQHMPNLFTRLKLMVGLSEARPIVRPSSKLRLLTQRVEYHAARAMFIILDALLVVWELEHASKVAMSGGESVSGGIRDAVGFIVFTDLCFIFLIADLLLNLILEYPRFDLLQGRTGYRWFNILALIEQMMQMIGHHQFRDKRSMSSFRITISQFSVLRVVRLLIVLPEIGLMRKQQFMGDLRVMIRSLTGALPPLFWCSATVFVIIITFGIFFSEGALAYLVKTDGMHSADSDRVNELKENFGTLFSSCFILYSAIFGGVDWADIYWSLGPLSAHIKLCFLFFICFTFVALMNVVTAVFIKCAFVRSENDRDFMIQKELDSKRDFLDTMRQIFQELDEDCNGRIGFEELAQHLQDPGVGAYFSKLGVDANEVEKLFALLDEDGSGSIDKEEFMFGCLRLKGEAKSLDLAILHQEVKMCSESLSDVRRSIHQRLEELELAMNHQVQDLGRLHQDVRLVAGDFQEVRNDFQELRPVIGDLQSFSQSVHGWILEVVELCVQKSQAHSQKCQADSGGARCQL